MDEKKFKPGDVVCLPHFTDVKYTVLGVPQSANARDHVQSGRYLVCAYNPGPNYELALVQLPEEALING